MRDALHHDLVGLDAAARPEPAGERLVERRAHDAVGALDAAAEPGRGVERR